MYDSQLNLYSYVVMINLHVKLTLSAVLFHIVATINYLLHFFSINPENKVRQNLKRLRKRLIFFIRHFCMHRCRFSLIKLSLAFSCLLVYFSTLWAESSHTCSSSYLEEGTKPELGHWFELILDPLAILNQLLPCESSPQTQLSFFLGGQCGGSGQE